VRLNVDKKIPQEVSMRTRARLSIGIAALALAFASVANAQTPPTCGATWINPPHFPAPGQFFDPPHFATNWFLPIWQPEPWLWTTPESWFRVNYPGTPLSSEMCVPRVLEPPIPRVPLSGENVYIPFQMEAVVSSGTAQSGLLYVGGWDQVFDAGMGGPPPPDPLGTNPARLEISGGTLNIGGCTCTPATGPCTFVNTVECYEFVGYRGAAGIVVQTGGEHHVANTLDIGRGSIETWGRYELHDGLLRPRGIDIGLQGYGEFEMTGGTLYSWGGASVGTGYFYGGQIDSGLPNEVLPGEGKFWQSGGTSTFVHEMVIGFQNGTAPGAERSSGYYELSELDGPAIANFLSILGGEGDAEIVLKGGTMNLVWHFILGQKPGGTGRFEIRDGSFTQSSCCGDELLVDGVPTKKGMHVGFRKDGVDQGEGTLMVDGAAALISIGYFYEQSSKGLLHLKVDAAMPPYISPITVGKTATFQPGAKLKFEFKGAELADRTIITLMTANQIVGPLPTILDNPAGRWRVYTEGSPPAMSLKAIYVIYPHCGLLGVEPLVVLGLLELKRRRRKRT
jgi:hypothetical protein